MLRLFWNCMYISRKGFKTMKEKEKKIEELCNLFRPIFRDNGSIDIVFSERVGYVLLVLSNPDKTDAVEMIESPEQLAEELLQELKSEFLYMAQLSDKLDIQSARYVEEYEAVMSDDLKRFFHNVVSYYQREIDTILSKE